MGLIISITVLFYKSFQSRRTVLGKQWVGRLIQHSLSDVLIKYSVVERIYLQKVNVIKWNASSEKMGN